MTVSFPLATLVWWGLHVSLCSTLSFLPATTPAAARLQCSPRGLARGWPLHARPAWLGPPADAVPHGSDSYAANATRPIFFRDRSSSA
jgi:hypothetical protein